MCLIGGIGEGDMAAPALYVVLAAGLNLGLLPGAALEHEVGRRLAWVPFGALVAAGLGVSVLPASYQRIRIDGVVYRTLLDQEAVTAVWLVQRTGAQSPRGRAVVELLTRKAVV